MGDLFGTDGVRGIPGRYPLVPELVRRMGYVAADTLLRRTGFAARNGSAPSILMARDSRASGAALERQLAQGFVQAGCVPVDAGVIPTPALAHLVPRRGVLCGVMVSASHNPAEFNGIKFFTADGFKMGPGIEGEIERRLASAAEGRAEPRGPAPARLLRDPRAEEDYFDYLRSTFPAHLDLSGMRIVLDCANGAAYRIAPRLLQALGAKVAAIGCSPDGSNINRGCGALETEAMRGEVARRRFDCGISLDGDADRAVFADSSGRLCDGDVLISMAAADLQERGLLKGGKVVLTVMSNYGLIRFLRSRGIGVVVVPVGDRNVTEAIEREGLSLGGESSGHIVFRRFCPTGDGLLTALQILAILAGSGERLAHYRGRYRACPQVLKNLRVETRVPLERLPRLRRKIRECERRLQGAGRILVRYSGTEPLLRILVEGPERAVCRKMAEDIAAAFARESGDLGPAARHLKTG